MISFGNRFSSTLYQVHELLIIALGHGTLPIAGTRPFCLALSQEHFGANACK